MRVVEDPELDLAAIAFRGGGGFPFSSFGTENVGGELDFLASYKVLSYPGFLIPSSALVQSSVNFRLPSADRHVSTAVFLNLNAPNPLPILSFYGCSGAPVIVDQKIVGVIKKAWTDNLSSTFERIRNDDSQRILELLATASAGLTS